MAVKVPTLAPQRFPNFSGKKLKLLLPEGMKMEPVFNEAGKVIDFEFFQDGESLGRLTSNPRFEGLLKEVQTELAAGKRIIGYSLHKLGVTQAGLPAMHYNHTEIINFKNPGNPSQNTHMDSASLQEGISAHEASLAGEAAASQAVETATGKSLQGTEAEIGKAAEGEAEALGPIRRFFTKEITRNGETVRTVEMTKVGIVGIGAIVGAWLLLKALGSDKAHERVNSSLPDNERSIHR